MVRICGKKNNNNNLCTFFCLATAKQHREMTNFCVVYGTWTTAAILFLYFHLELNAVIAYLARHTILEPVVC